MTKPKATVEKCGFFIHSYISELSSSPDAISPTRLIFEIEARALNSEGSSYSAQTEQQMACIHASFRIFLSYQVETEFGNFFLIQKGNVLIDVIAD